MDSIINGNYAPNFNDTGLQDFINDANYLDQFIDLIKGESAADHDPVVSNYNSTDFNYDLFNGDLVYYCNQFAQTGDGDLFDFNATTTMSDPSSILLSSLPSIDVGMEGGGEDENDGGDSSATTTTTTPTKKTKGDRSRTLISERRRRGRMKEKLYALRSLVPNITKMDKASIVGDAVLYVQELQMQAKKLKAEIAGLESSITQGEERYQGSAGNPKRIQVAINTFQNYKKIMQMDMFQVEERGFYVRLVCNKVKGVAVSLYKALESLQSFNIQSSNLASISDKFVLTFTMNARERRDGMNLPNLKLWITGALLNQGFEFKTSV